MCTRDNLLDYVLNVSDANVKWKTCSPGFVYHVKLMNRYKVKVHTIIYVYICDLYIHDIECNCFSTLSTFLREE